MKKIKAVLQASYLISIIILFTFIDSSIDSAIKNNLQFFRSVNAQQWIRDSTNDGEDFRTIDNSSNNLNLSSDANSSSKSNFSLHVKSYVLGNIANDSCNFYIQQNLTVAPWYDPNNQSALCMIYQTDFCNQYEISYDQTKINSCNLTVNCTQDFNSPNYNNYWYNLTYPNSTSPSLNNTCIYWYQNQNYQFYDNDGAYLWFPESGQMCLFNESKYALKPWPQNCKIYQGSDWCAIYELDDLTSSYVVSCDLPMYPGQCVAPNPNFNQSKQNNTCLQYCPSGGCAGPNLFAKISFSFGMLAMLALLLVQLV